MRVYGTRRITDRSYEGLLRYAARRDALLSGRPPRLLYAKYAVESFSVAGCPGYRIGPEGPPCGKGRAFSAPAARSCCKLRPSIIAGLRI